LSVPTEAVTALPARPVAVAALYDVHGNPAALEAVLAEAGDDQLVFGGDLAAGPVPAETLDRIMELDALVIRGNADRELFGDETGGLLDEWVRAQLDDRHREYIARLPDTVELDVESLGRVLFCHGSPRSDEEMILRTTPDEWLREMVADVEADVVVCGHTHMQFRRQVDGITVVNAGSVGLPNERPPLAYWALLGPDVEHRRTDYDLEAAISDARAVGYPDADGEYAETLRHPASAEEAVAFFEQLALEKPEFAGAS
jgi:putative phosphoesterase